MRELSEVTGENEAVFSSYQPKWQDCGLNIKLLILDLFWLSLAEVVLTVQCCVALNFSTVTHIKG